MAQKITPAQMQKEWYEELGRATASGGANPSTLSVTFTARKYLKILILQHSGGANLTTLLRFNSDSGANYDYRLQENASADVATNTQTGFNLGSNTLDGMQGELLVTNEAAYVKNISGIFNYFSASSGSIFRNLVGGKWNNASVQITSAQIVASTGSFKDGSELIILGHD